MYADRLHTITCCSAPYAINALMYMHLCMCRICMAFPSMVGDAANMFKMMMDFKEYLKNKKVITGLPPSREYITSYPDEPEQLPPVIYQHAFGEDPPLAVQLEKLYEVKT